MKMRKLLIIDDEPIIREGLRSIISWADYGYKICDVGVDGNDGLNKVRSHHPDLVLLDIRMPGLSGIELIQQVRKEKFTCKFIILTAYSNFSYAKELMALGVVNYLLKPVDEDELIQAIDKIAIDRAEEQKLKDQLALYNGMNREKSLQALLVGNFDYVSESIMKELHDKKFQVARLSSEIKQDNYLWMLKKISGNAKKIELIRKENCEHLLFINIEEPEVKEFLVEIQKRLSLNGDEHLALMVGSAVNGTENIVRSYLQAKELVDVYFCFSEESILDYQELEALNKSNTKSLKGLNKQMVCDYLEYGDESNIEKEILNLEQYYKNARYSKERVRAEIIESFISVFHIITRNYPALEMMSKEELASNINKQDNLRSICVYITRELASISKLVCENTTNKGNIIDKIKNYVNNYYYEDISLKLVADLFHYNSAYLGKAFKQQTGEFFNAYLHQVRIKNAKKLMENKRYKIYEISQLVGYSNSDYFYKNFRLYEGISPKEYQMKNNLKV